MSLPGRPLPVPALPVRAEPDTTKALDTLVPLKIERFAPKREEISEWALEHAAGNGANVGGGGGNGAGLSAAVIVLWDEVHRRACGLLCADRLSTDLQSVGVSLEFMEANALNNDQMVEFRVVAARDVALTHLVLDVPSEEALFMLSDANRTTDNVADSDSFDRNCLRRCLVGRPVFIGLPIPVAGPGVMDGLQVMPNDGIVVGKNNTTFSLRVADCRPGAAGVVTEATVVFLRVARPVAAVEAAHSASEAVSGLIRVRHQDDITTPRAQRLPQPGTRSRSTLELSSSLMLSMSPLVELGVAPLASTSTLAVSPALRVRVSSSDDAAQSDVCAVATVDNCVYVHWTVLRDLGSFSGSYLAASMASASDSYLGDESIAKRQRRWVRALEADCDPERSGCGIVSPGTFFAIAEQNFWELWRRNCRSSANTPIESSMTLESIGAGPAVAEECVLARVRRPASVAWRDCSLELAEFFSKPQLVHVGDIIAVHVQVPPNVALLQDALSRPIGFPTRQRGGVDAHVFSEHGQPEPYELTGTTSLSSVANDATYELFRVISLGHLNLSEPSGAFVDRDQTRLIQQSESVGCRLPPKAFESLSSNAAWHRVEKHWRQQFRNLLDATLCAISAVPKSRQMQPCVLISSPAGSTVASSVRDLSDDVGLRCIYVNCYLLLDGVVPDDICAMVGGASSDDFEKVTGSSRISSRSLGETHIATILWECAQRAAMCGPCVLHLDYINALEEASRAHQVGGEEDRFSVLADTLRELSEHFAASREDNFVFLCGSTCQRIADIRAPVRAAFTHEIDLWENSSDMSEVARSFIRASGLRMSPSTVYSLESTFQSFPSRNRDSVARVLCSSADFAVARVSSAIGSLPAVLPHVCPEDVEAAAKAHAKTLQKTETSSAASVEVPTTRWSDVGGLAHVREAVAETIELPLKFPHMFASGGKKRSGLLFWGPPGTGKTLVAKAVATECGLKFLSVKGPELLDMYVGESERNVRAVFENAREHAPCVIFFDELDSLAPARGRGADSGGVMDRVVSQLLSELDGMHDGDDSTGPRDSVFVIGATNRPDLIDSGLLRPGRFEKLLYLGPCETLDAKFDVLRAQTRKMPLLLTPHVEQLQANAQTDVVDLKEIAAMLPDVTPADIHALCSDAMLAALTETICALESARLATNGGTSSKTASSGNGSAPGSSLKVGKRHFANAIARLSPSVSAAEMARYESIRDKYAALA